MADRVNRVAATHKDLDTYTEAEVRLLLSAIADDRLGHTWELALTGLRRGEIAGLRWSDCALDTLSIANNRVSAGGRSVENDPKSVSSRRTLPLRSAGVSAEGREGPPGRRKVISRLGLRLGAHVVSNEVGEPYSPAVLSRYWRDTVKAAGVRHIKLHAARHTLRDADAPPRGTRRGNRGVDRT